MGKNHGSEKLNLRKNEWNQKQAEKEVKWISTPTTKKAAKEKERDRKDERKVS